MRFTFVAVSAFNELLRKILELIVLELIFEASNDSIISYVQCQASLRQ